MASRDRPTLCLLRQWDGAGCREVTVVCGAQGKVAHELEVAYRVGPQLEVADGEAVGRGAAKGRMVDGLEGEGEAGASGGRAACMLVTIRNGYLSGWWYSWVGTACCRGAIVENFGGWTGHVGFCALGQSGEFLAV